MTVADRRREISDLLLLKGKVKVGELAQRFQVSTETIRKDLLELESQGFIKKNKGSAEVLVETSASAYSHKSKKFVELKKMIARKAAQLVPPNSVIFIDAGSTNYQLAWQLIMRKDIIVVTNFSPIAELLNANEINVVLIGGEIRHVSGAATGMLASYCIEHIQAEIAFLGASGFLDSNGPCVENFAEAEVKRKMLQNASDTYVLADSSKATTRAIAKYAEWSEITGLLTDDKLDPNILNSLRENIDVILVNTKEEE